MLGYGEADIQAVEAVGVDEQGVAGGGIEADKGLEAAVVAPVPYAVSYTHLTLPTILRV